MEMMKTLGLTTYSIDLLVAANGALREAEAIGSRVLKPMKAETIALENILRGCVTA